MDLQTNRKVFNATAEAYKEKGIRYIVNRGGTRSGKTYSILQLLVFIMLKSKKPLTISVITATFPQLRIGALRDFQNIVKDYPHSENKTEHSFKLGNSLIEFLSMDDSKALGGQRDILFINECNRLNYEVVRQLTVRTAKKVFLDFNPVCHFWANERIFVRNDVVVIDSTYKDNEYLPEAQVAEIESHKNDTNWWRVYGLGLEGRIEGLVFPDWDMVESIPEGCRVRYGMDFGFNDPTTIIRVGVKEKDLYLDEECYQRGLICSDISARLEQGGVKKRADRIIADSAGAEQIETLYRMGWNIHSCKKGKDSVVSGLKKMKEYKIHITKRSVNLQNEMLNYMWEKDKNDNKLDVPIDAFNHAIDASRYALQDLEGNSGTYNIGFAR